MSAFMADDSPQQRENKQTEDKRTETRYRVLLLITRDDEHRTHFHRQHSSVAV